MKSKLESIKGKLNTTCKATQNAVNEIERIKKETITNAVGIIIDTLNELPDKWVNLEYCHTEAKVSVYSGGYCNDELNDIEVDKIAIRELELNKQGDIIATLDDDTQIHLTNSYNSEVCGLHQRVSLDTLSLLLCAIDEAVEQKQY